MAETNLMSLTRRIVAGDMRALASAMTLIESGDPSWESMVPPKVAQIIKNKGLFGVTAS